MIYIVCPANIATGGPELLHQLGYKLRILGFDAVMYYYSTTGAREMKSPVCDRYVKYKVPYTYKIIDTSENIVIFPEVTIKSANVIKNAVKIIWWLSVDHARCDGEMIEKLKKEDFLHFSQSQYSTDFLYQIGIPGEKIYYLSDYINSEFLITSLKFQKEDIVLFNPKKGFSITSNIIRNSSARIKWQALSGLEPHKMHEVMQKAKVYIDFGHHPGKDRIPREAVMSGCCVITNKSGSAYNEIDVMIPEKYKFNAKVSTQDILEVIYDLIDNYEEKKNDYVDYIQRTEREFIEFEKDVLFIFEKLLKGDTYPFSQDEYISMIQTELENGNYSGALKYFVKYRLLNYPENIITDILETNIRIGLKEYKEAEYCAKRGLKKDVASYEIYLLLAQICFLSVRDKESYIECINYCKKALEYSVGSKDEKDVMAICDIYIKEIGKRFE